jgi:flagellar biosynthetic protein FlhB
MSEFAEKTEQPTPRRLEEAQKKGQVARSAEVQTVFVLLAALAALAFTGRETFMRMAGLFSASLGHLHDIPLSANALQGYSLHAALFIASVAGPVLLATSLGGLLAGGLQNRFTTASEVVKFDWQRISPVAGFKRLFSFRQAAPTGIAILKLAIIIGLSYAEIHRILNDPIFGTAVSLGHISAFFADSALRIFLRIALALAVVAAADYGYHWWRTQQDLMMTRQEVKEELKSSEGNPRFKAARRRLRAISKRKMLAEVPKADVVVVNPVHIAVALRYDRKSMKAPRVVAKGVRLNALQIKEAAQKHKVPILENKPLARMLFKYGKVGGEVPAQLYAAVAEVLAWVYRVNRYRYFSEQNRTN